MEKVKSVETTSVPHLNHIDHRGSAKPVNTTEKEDTPYQRATCPYCIDF